MLKALSTLLAPILATVLNLQVPSDSRYLRHSAPLNDSDSIGWSLEKLPNPDAADHLVFETVHSLLQRWPNVRMRNGHNIVPGTVPKGTLLYHGTNDQKIPVGPEWVATDPDFSYMFSHEKSPHQGSWQLILVTTRPLKVVYFDGSSAAKFPYGSLDTQDLIVWGSSPVGSEWNEAQRIKDLCAWGKNFGMDAIVRMADNFELMLCSFTSGVTVVSFVNLPAPRNASPATCGYLFTGFTPLVVAGSWHDRFPGETRIQLDLTGLVSFYDTGLVPSLVPIRAGQERWDHRVQNTSSKDLSALKSRLEGALIRTPGSSSGVDWKTLIQIIVDRFAGRLELTRHLLNTSAIDPEAILDAANKTQTQLRIMLTPYILRLATPTDPLNNADLAWTTPIYKLCATTHTQRMDTLLGSMTNSERLVLQAVRGTSREICRVVTKMWAAGVYAGIDASLNTKESPNTAGVTHVLKTWREDLNQLMVWLDWSIWVKCNPECSPEEMCHLPVWPYGFPGFPPPKRRLPVPNRYGPQERVALPGTVQTTTKPGQDEWIRPQPKCVRRVDTFEF